MMIANLDEFEPLSAPVRAMCEALAEGRDLGAVVATWVCQTAAVHEEGLRALTANDPNSWETVLLLRLATGTVGEDAEYLDTYMPKERDPNRAADERPCPKCDATGALPYTGRSGEATTLKCWVCSGSGSLAELIASAHQGGPYGADPEAGCLAEALDLLYAQLAERNTRA
jgi:hypothetical protein